MTFVDPDVRPAAGGFAATSRRRFMQAGIGLAGLAGLAGPAAAAKVGGATHFMHRIIFDMRFAESRMFGAEADRLGQATVALDGDVGRLWTDHLAPLWSGGPAAIAGMTAPDALFCIERLAYDAGLRLVLRIDHRRHGAGGVDHHCEDDAVLAAFGSVGRTAFPTRSAEILMACSRHAMALGPTCLAPRRAGDEEPLISWAFAPKIVQEERI